MNNIAVANFDFYLWKVYAKSVDVFSLINSLAKFAVLKSPHILPLLGKYSLKLCATPS